MKSWKNNVYYLGITLLAAALIYTSQLTYMHYKALYETSFTANMAQLAYLSRIGGAFVIGLLLGVESLLQKQETPGMWRVNWGRAFLVGLPALAGALWFIPVLHGLNIPALQVWVLSDNEPLLAAMAGWALGGSIYKKPGFPVNLQVGSPDDQQG